MKNILWAVPVVLLVLVFILAMVEAINQKNIALVAGGCIVLGFWCGVGYVQLILYLRGMKVTPKS